jgi:hypothetical protein
MLASSQEHNELIDSQPSLADDALERSQKYDSSMQRDGNDAGFHWMTEVRMAPGRPHDLPAVSLKRANCLPGCEPR